MKLKYNQFIKNYIFFINFYFFFINILLFNLEYKKSSTINKIINDSIFNKSILQKFKNSDYHIFSLLMRKYLQISNYINSNYRIRYKKLEKAKIKIKRKKIIIYSVDLFDEKYHKLWIKDKLKDKFIIKFNSNNPDYLIYNIFGNNHLRQKYNKAIKIAIYTENQIPDFNQADYAIGQAHINYLDRYFKFPIFLWHNFKNFYKIREEVLNNHLRTKFCAAVISNNSTTNGFRNNFINELNNYKKVDMGGRFNNNIGYLVNDKIEFFSSYKFSIAMENSEGDGYISEKIIDSFLSGTIPIYYGDAMIDEYINPKSFILIKNDKDIKEKIEYIKKIDKNDEIYKSLLKENIILDTNISNKIEKEEKEFLQHIFEQEKLKAFRKN